MPIPGRPNLQKVFMLHEIVLSAQPLMGGVADLPTQLKKTPTGTFGDDGIDQGQKPANK